MMRLLSSAVLSLAVLWTGGCQTVTAPSTAQVDLSHAPTYAAVAGVLAKAVGRARVELGPQGGGKVAVVTVLPPRPVSPETNSPAMPITFDIRMKGGLCVAVNRETHENYPLTGIACSVHNSP